MENNIDQYFKSFLEYLAAQKQVSALTIQNYKFYLSRFNLLIQVKEPADINIETVNKFRELLGQIRNQRGELMKPVTQNYHLIALRAFLAYLKNLGLTVLGPETIILNKIGKNIISTVEPQNIEKLLESPLHAKNPSLIQKRDKAILELLLSTGLKVSELSALKKGQIDFLKNSLTIRGLGDRLRTVELTNQAKYWIKQYLESRQDNFPALFIRHDKAKTKQLNKILPEAYQLTPRTIQRIIKKYAKAAQLDPGITPQTLRNSYAKYLLEKGEDIKTIQSILGHASVVTTHLYTK
ncbi:MAG: tyrosine-type recombinase/integrase [Patescibacteria group bacterium]|jgi:site-specific recombinase XerD